MYSFQLKIKSRMAIEKRLGKIKRQEDAAYGAEARIAIHESGFLHVHGDVHKCAAQDPDGESGVENGIEDDKGIFFVDNSKITAEEEEGDGGGDGGQEGDEAHQADDDGDEFEGQAHPGSSIGGGNGNDEADDSCQSGNDETVVDVFEDATFKDGHPGVEAGVGWEETGRDVGEVAQRFDGGDGDPVHGDEGPEGGEVEDDDNEQFAQVETILMRGHCNRLGDGLVVCGPTCFSLCHLQTLLC